MRFHSSLVGLAALAGLAACQTPVVTPQEPPIQPPPRPPDRPPPAARAVLQPRLFQWQRRRVVTPTRTWEWVRENGFSLIDGDRRVAVGNIFSPYSISAVAFSPDGEDLVVLWNDPRLAHDPEWRPASGGQQRLLERWSLSTRTRRWSSVLPPPTVQPTAYADAPSHITFGEKGIFVTRCQAGRATSCEVLPISAADGTPGAPSVSSLGPMSGSWGIDRIDSKSGRFSIERQGSFVEAGMRRPGEPDYFAVFDGEGRPRGQFLARCARFDEQDRLLVQGFDERTRAAVQAIGLETRDDARACVPALPEPAPLPMPLNQTGLLDLPRPLISGHHVLWHLYHLDRKTFSLDTSSVALPARFTLPPDDPKHPDAHWALGDTSPDIYAQFLGRYAHYRDVTAAPEMGAVPHDGPIWTRGAALLLGHWLPADDSRWLLDLGSRPAPDQPIKWRPIEASTTYVPGFALTEQAGKGVLTLAGGRQGLQRVDPASGRLLSRTCTTSVDGAGRCANDKFVGLVATPDGARAYTYHTENHEIGKNPETRFLEIDLVTGKVARSFPAPYFSFESPEGFGMGWLEPGKRFWFLGNLVYPSAQTCIVTVTLPSGASNEPVLAMSCLAGRALAVTGDPAGRYFASFRALDTVDFHAPDGEEVLLAGTRGDDAFAQTRDGRFACTGAACDEFRCVVGDDVRPITDPACQSLRAPGFSLEAELAKPR
jgi:hypothetical protein